MKTLEIEIGFGIAKAAGAGMCYINGSTIDPVSVENFIRGARQEGLHMSYEGNMIYIGTGTASISLRPRYIHPHTLPPHRRGAADRDNERNKQAFQKWADNLGIPPLET